MSSPLKSSSFNNEDEEDLYPPTPPSKSRKPEKETIKNNNNKADIKNPYASRGLDKFSELLADLEMKKKRIYSQKDVEKIAAVRFAYSSSNDLIPIKIKSKDEEKAVSLQETIKQDHDKPIAMTKSQVNTKNEVKVVSQQEIKKDHHRKPRKPISVTFEEIKKQEEIKKPHLETEKISLLPYWEIYLEILRQPCYYGVVVIVLILVLLTFVGRSMAILFTSLGLYVVPLITTAEKPMRKKRRKSKRLDENKIARDGFTKEELEVKRLSDIETQVHSGAKSVI